MLLHVPRSIPITWPLTFPSPPEDWHRINEDAKGERATGERENVEVVRGS